MDTEESLFTRFLPQFTEDAQARVTAVADDEMRFIGTTGMAGG